MYRLLLIEDEEDLLASMADSFRYDGFEVFTAHDGMLGIDMAHAVLPDLIVCDVTMPGLDGHRVLMELHSHPFTSGIPFVFLTAHGDLDDIRKGMNLGADDYLVKPCRHEDLLNAVLTRLAKRKHIAGQYERAIDILEDALTSEHEQNSQQSRFLSMISHDLRTALSSVLSSEQLLRTYYDRLTPEKRESYFGRIERNVKQMLNLLDDLLAIGQAQAGKNTLVYEDMEFDVLCREVVEDFSQMYNRSHAVVLDVQPDVSFSVVMDRKFMQRVLMNLLTNAIKYSPDGSRVEVRISREADSVVLVVQDEGIGIPLEAQQQLFSIYQRAKNVGNVHGTGLGLAIVKHAVDLHAGTIHLESVENRGTTFVIRLPQSPPAPPQSTGQAEDMRYDVHSSD